MWLYLNHFLDLIPVWVWIVVVAIMLAFTYQFWAPIWLLLPRPVKIALGAVAALFAAFLGGRYKGAKDTRELQQARDASAIKTRDEIDMRVRNASDADIKERLKRWQRD